MSSPIISDQKYALPPSPGESTLSRDKAMKMMDQLNQKLEETGFRAYLGERDSVSSTASVDEYSNSDSSTSDEMSTESDDSIGVPQRKGIPKEFVRRQKEANMRYNTLTPVVQDLFRNPENQRSQTTLEKEHINVKLLQDLANKCRKSMDKRLMEKIHKHIKAAGYPQEWASDMIRICSVNEDTILKKISDQALDMKALAKAINRSVSELFEYMNSGK